MNSDELGLRCDNASALAHLRKESLDIYSRLHSVEEDVAFVSRVLSSYPHLPILPNLRCGTWYVDPNVAREEPAYFKSTDGHYNNWSFNLRRPNLHLLHIVLSDGGFMLVDSTRSGKRVPDALSKTVPIWCAVISRAVAIKYSNADKLQWDTALYCPPGAVTSQEMAQIDKHIDGWVRSLLSSSYVLPDLPHPLRPLWITPSTAVLPEVPSGAERAYFPIVCVSASKSISEGLERRANGFTYVQGSGDDHELWGMGLTPQVFWEHKDELLAAERSELPNLVTSLVKEARSRMRKEHWNILPTPISNIEGLMLICAIPDLPSLLPPHLPGSDINVAFVVMTSQARSESLGESAVGALDNVLHIHLAEGKKEQIHYLQSVLPQSLAFIGFNLCRGAQVCICCDSGKDASAGVVLAALQMLFDDSGKLASTPQQQATLRTSACKQSIHTRLQWIISSRPQVNPSRATLKRVNEFLLSSPAFRRQR